MVSITPWEQPIIPKLKRHTIASLLAKGVRIDGRKLEQFRPIEVTAGYIERAEGSALAKIGDTMVIAGVKMDLAEPFPDTPNEGILVVNAEYMPIASPHIEPGPPDENAIELARIIDRSLREMRVIPLEKLVIEPGKIVWRVYVDVYVLNHDGNVTDAAMLATMAALMTTRMPGLVKEGDEYKVDRTRYVGLLPIDHRVVSVTISKIENKLLVDPNYEEETMADVRLFVAVSEDGRIAGLQKMGVGALSLAEIDRAINIAIALSKQLLNVLEEKAGKYRAELEKLFAEKKEKRVRETKCWGIGFELCEFEIKIQD
ncbi:MAG TPA: exosome complex protein Rrp42 [Pyrodictiaceae archaeon]|nr:exosome complex protein Rrp42 [Pyrodictiaceae archaeon]